MKGLEPPRLTAQDPKSCAATNYATSAFEFGAKIPFFTFCETLMLNKLNSNQVDYDFQTGQRIEGVPTLEIIFIRIKINLITY
jgi:hypothetical protein